MTADGEKYVYDDPHIIDERRKKQIEDKQSAINSLPYPSTRYKWLGWISIILLVLDTVFVKFTEGIPLLFFPLFFILWIIFKVRYHRADNSRYKEKGALESELKTLCDEHKEKKKEFLQNGKTFAGL